MVRELTTFAPLNLQPIPEGATELASDEAEALQAQIDTLSAALTTTQAALSNAEQVNSALIQRALTDAAERRAIEASVTAVEDSVTALAGTHGYPAPGESFDTGRLDDGRPVLRNGVGPSVHGGITSGGNTVIGTGVWKLIDAAVILHLIGNGTSFQTIAPYADGDTAFRYATVEVNSNNGDIAIAANLPNGMAVQNWWGWVEWTER